MREAPPRHNNEMRARTRGLDCPEIHRTCAGPMDSRRRALIVTAYAFISMGTLGMHYAFSVVYVQLLEALGGNPEITALVGTLGIFFMDGLGLFSGAIVQHFGSRPCAVLGAALTALGWCCSSFVTAPWQLLFSWSILVGFGHSLVLFGAITIMPLWFSKRLALAHAIGNAGGAVAPFLFGTFVPSLFDAVGWRNAFLILGAINGCVNLVAGLLLSRPPSVHLIAVQQNAAEKSPMAHKRAWALSMELLRSRRFQLLSLSSFGFGAGAWVGVVHLVRIATSSGMPEADASRLLVYLSLGSVVLRLPVAFSADLIGRRRACCLALGTNAAMNLACALPDARSSSAFLSAFAFCLGGLNGSVLSTSASLPSELLPEDQRGLAGAAIYTPVGIGFLVGPVVGAALEHATGNYAATMLAAGGSLTCAVAIMLYLATLGMGPTIEGRSHTRPPPSQDARSARGDAVSTGSGAAGGDAEGLQTSI